MGWQELPVRPTLINFSHYGKEGSFVLFRWLAPLAERGQILSLDLPQMGKRPFWGKTNFFFLIFAFLKTVDVDEDFCLKMQSLQSIPAQPDSK